MGMKGLVFNVHNKQKSLVLVWSEISDKGIIFFSTLVLGGPHERWGSFLEAMVTFIQGSNQVR